MSVLKDLRRASHHSPQDGKQFCWNYLDQPGAQLTVISDWTGKCFCFSWKLVVLTTILLQLRLELHGVSNP